MKKLLAVLLIAFPLFTSFGCSSNALDSNYENSDPDNMEEVLYEEEMGDPGLTANWFFF